MSDPIHPPISTIDKLACIRREISYRQGFYPKLVRSGKMTQEDMDREILVLQVIGRDYERQLYKERGQKGLFEK